LKKPGLKQKTIVTRQKKLKFFFSKIENRKITVKKIRKLLLIQHDLILLKYLKIIINL